MSNRTFLGKVGMTPKGEWNNSTTYERLDIVSYEGSSYIAIVQNRNSRPSEDNQDWMIGAKHGEFTEEQLEEFKEAVVAESKQEMDDFTQEQKAELESYEEAKETELNNYTNDKKADIDTHTVSKINDYNTNAYQKETAFNTNATSKTNTFNNNAETKTTDFNDNATSKINAYNQNAEDKTTTFNTNASTKQNTFDTNATQKTNTFNTNATSKTTDFNTNAASKKSDYDTNATTKLEAYNTNATEKTEAFDQNAEDKTADFDEHVQELEEAIPLLQQETEDLLNAGYKIYTETPAESVTLNKTSKNRFVKFGVNGNREQGTVAYVDVGTWEQGSINGTTGVKESSSTTIRTDYIQIYPNVLYNISRSIYTQFMAFRFYDTNKSFLGTQATEGMVTTNKEDNRMNNGSSTMEMTINNSNVAYMKMIDTTNDLSTIYTISTEATPSPTYKQDIHAVGDNGVVNIEKCNKNIFDEKIEQGNINSSGQKKQSATRVRSKNFTQIKENTIYTLNHSSGNDLKVTVFQYAKNGDFIGYADSGWKTVPYTFTTAQGVEKIALLYHFNDEGNIVPADVKNCQLELGSLATSYTPHEGETFNMPCQKPMPGVEDYFDWDNEKEIHGWKKLVLDGTENVTRTTAAAAPFGFYFTIPISPNSDYPTDGDISSMLISTHFRIVENSIAKINAGCMTLSSSKNKISFAINEEITTSAAAKTWLAEQYANGTPVIIYYKSAEPEQLPFTEAQKEIAKQIKNSTSYYEQTNVFSNDEVSPIYDVTAVGDLNLVIDEIVAMQIALGGEINNG